jgi:transposase
MIEVDEILYRWTKGMSERKIAKSLGISRNTVKKILSKAKAQGITKASTPQEQESKAKDLFNRLYNKKKAGGHAQIYLSGCHDQIKAWLSSPYMTVNQMVRLFNEQGHKVSETSLRRYIRKHIPSLPPSTIHLTTTPGYQAQVDFGYVGTMKNPATQKESKAYAFIMTCSHSRYRFVRFVFKQDSKTWIDCHIRAFQFFGGVPVTVVIDNLKSGIITPDFYDPIVNRAYGELEKHYGFVCDPTKVRTPQHKGKVERSVTIVRQQVIAGRTFKDIEEANAYALQWCRHEIGMTPSRTTGQKPWELFVKEEKPAS